MSSDASQQAQLLVEIVPDILPRIFGYCDGRSLSTLLLATASCPQHDRLVGSIISELVETKLKKIAAHVEEKATSDLDRSSSFDRGLRDASQWIYSIATPPVAGSSEGGVGTKQQYMRLISENLAVLDYLEESLREYSSGNCLEWPVWCGQLTIDSFMTGSRVRSNARVIITSPMQKPSFLPGGNSLLKNHCPNSVFRCEPYNMVPVPPWGQIRGLQVQDSHILQPVVQRLINSNQLAIPSGFHSYNALDIRLVSKHQAVEHLRRIQHLPTSWLLHKDPTVQLLCCWQDDSSGLKNNRDYIGFILDYLNAKRRLHRSQEPSEREC